MILCENEQTDKNVDILTWSIWTGDIINHSQLPLPIYSQVWLFKLPTFVGSWKKTRKFQKNIYFCFIDYTKAFDCVKSESESYSAMSDFLSVLSDSFCTVRGILQASTLEWVAFPFSKGSSQFRGWTLHCRQILYQLSYQGSPQ